MEKQELIAREAIEDEEGFEETATMCPTKAGNGFKVVVNGVWFYASRKQVLDMVRRKQKACTFHTITDDLPVTQ
jgi:hypothetical protein